MPDNVVSTPIVRPHPMIRFPGNGQTERVDLHRGLRVRELVFRLVGGLTLTAAQNVPANFKRGDELGAIARLIVWFRGQIIFNVAGDDIWWLMFQRTGNRPPTCPNFGDGTTINPTFDTTFTLHHWLPRAGNPDETILSTSGASDYRVEVTYNAPTSVNTAAGTTYASNPTITIEAEELDYSDKFRPLFELRTIEKIVSFDSATEAGEIELDSGEHSYAQITLATLHSTTGADTSGLLSYVRLGAQGRYYRQHEAARLQQWAAHSSGMNLGLHSTPNAAQAQLTHAVGTADGTIADVGAAFSQTTLNDNLRELSNAVNKIALKLNGQTEQGRFRVSPESDPRAWFYLNLVRNGRLAEAVPAIRDLKLEVKLTGACKVKVITTQLHPIRYAA